MAQKQKSNTDFTRIKFAIGYGLKNKAKVKNQELPWPDLQKKLLTPKVDTDLTTAQYDVLSTEEKGVVKCGDFFVGGHCKGGKRNRENLTERSVLNLDVDHATQEQFEDFRNGRTGLGGYTYAAHTTRSHTPGRPKFRVFIPLKYPVDVVHFVAISRIIAAKLFGVGAKAGSMDATDDASYRATQMMYLPSMSKDQEFWSHANEGEFLDVDEELSKFNGDWLDISQLPHSEKRSKKRLTMPGVHAEDPTTKRGIIGACCRAYDVEGMIAEYLSDTYTLGDGPGATTRYTYVQGSTPNGAIVFDDGLFLFSYHDSDPTSEQLCNAFDLLRIHRFGHLDKGQPANTGPTNLRSYIATEKLLQKDEEVMAELVADYVPSMAFEEVEDDNDDLGPETVSDPDDDLLGPEVPEETGGHEFEVVGDDDDRPVAKKKKKPKKKASRDWANHLTRDKNHNLEKTKANINRIMCNDIRFCNSIAKNELTGTPHLMRPLNFPRCEIHTEPVPNDQDGRPWTDTDTAASSICLSEPVDLDGYGTEFTDQQLQAAMLMAAQKNSFNPVKRHMEREVWDGVERKDTFFIDFFKAEDTPYHRECGHIFFMGAVLRTYEPGCVFRLVTVWEGEEDIGKSGALQVLAFGKYHAELSADFKDKKDLVEQQRGAVIVELGELSGMSRSRVDDVKRHLSAVTDKIRLA
jgi:Ruegeria phage DNA helicase